MATANPAANILNIGNLSAYVKQKGRRSLEFTSLIKTIGMEPTFVYSPRLPLASLFLWRKSNFP